METQAEAGPRKAAKTGSDPKAANDLSTTTVDKNQESCSDHLKDKIKLIHELEDVKKKLLGLSDQCDRLITNVRESASEQKRSTAKTRDSQTESNGL